MSVIAKFLASQDLSITRRNILAISAILSSSVLEGCKIRTLEDRDREQREFAPPLCFLKGTRLSTPSGEVKIEDLEIGDQVTMLDGTSRRIRGIGQRRLKVEKQINGGSANPVRFMKGSLDADLPKRDLLISRDHRLFMFGMLIRADEFINGRSIVDETSDREAEFEYFHVLTDGDHGIIYAEGVPSETLLFENWSIRNFDSFRGLDGQDDAAENGSIDPYAPVFRCNQMGKRARIKSHLRSALSPWIDLRNDADRVRDLLADKARMSSP